MQHTDDSGTFECPLGCDEPTTFAMDALELAELIDEQTARERGVCSDCHAHEVDGIDSDFRCEHRTS